MREQGRHRGHLLLVPVVSGLGALLAFLILLSGSASAQATKDDQKCINTVNKNAAKIVKAQGKDICACIKDGAKGKLVGQTIEECTTADNKGKVLKAKAKLDEKIAKDCASYPSDPNDPNGFFPVDPNNPDFIKGRAMAKDLALIHWIFGSDLDTVIVSEGDPNTPNAKDTSKCQQQVAKQAKKCQDEKLKEFNKCKKDGMKGKIPPGQISSKTELETLCLMTGADPNTGQPDPKGKIVKACDVKLADKIQKKCTDKSVDLSLAFPNFDPNSGTLKDFVDVRVECRVCRFWNAIDGLNRDCDRFDDGSVNGSCDGILYASDRVGGPGCVGTSSLYTIDITTGAATLVGALPSPATEIEFDPLTQQAFLQLPNGCFAAQEFDINTGGALGGPVINVESFQGLEYVAGILYGTSIPGAPTSTLRILNPLTGFDIVIGLTGIGQIAGLAFDSASGTMYGIEGGPGPADLVTVDLGLGTATPVGSTGIQAGSLQFGPDGRLYAGGTGPDAGDLYIIDPSTGTATLLGATGMVTVTGLTLGP